MPLVRSPDPTIKIYFNNFKGKLSYFHYVPEVDNIIDRDIVSFALKQAKEVLEDANESDKKPLLALIQGGKA